MCVFLILLGVHSITKHPQDGSVVLTVFALLSCDV